MSISTGGRLRPIAVVGRSDVRADAARSARVSVVIPNYNYARFLPEAVGSTLAQSGVDVDVIVVDDASTDDSAEVMRGLADADARVRILLAERNRGAVGTFNAGLELAEGEYIVRLDADDLLTPGALSRAVALADAFPGTSLVYGRPLHFEGAAPDVQASAPTSWTVWGGSDWLEQRCRTGVNCITSPEVVMRGSAVRMVGGQRPDLPHAHDMEMWFRLATVGDVGHVDGVPQGLHREHAGSLSDREVDVMGDLHHRADVYAKLLDGPGGRNAELLGLARRALADEAVLRLSQAYAAGRGGSAETEGYLTFAREQGVDLSSLPSWPAAARSLRLGPGRARRDPRLLLRAVRMRGRSRRAYARTLITGV